MAKPASHSVTPPLQNASYRDPTDPSIAETWRGGPPGSLKLDRFSCIKEWIFLQVFYSSDDKLFIISINLEDSKFWFGKDLKKSAFMALQKSLTH